MERNRYEETKEEILPSNIVAINKTAVTEPSLERLSVGDHIGYVFVAKKGKVQLWCGIIVSNDPDAAHNSNCHALHMQFSDSNYFPECLLCAQEIRNGKQVLC